MILHFDGFVSCEAIIEGFCMVHYVCTTIFSSIRIFRFSCLDIICFV